MTPREIQAARQWLAGDLGADDPLIKTLSDEEIIKHIECSGWLARYRFRAAILNLWYDLKISFRRL